jgi:hypothetical protein
MFDSLLDSVTKRVLKLHNLSDYVLEDVSKIPEVLEASEVDATRAVEEIDKMEGHLNQMRLQFDKAIQGIRAAKSHVIETIAVTDEIHSEAGNAAQFALPESKAILVAHDQRLFEQSAGGLNPKDLRFAVSRLNKERIQLIQKYCLEILAELDLEES